MVRVTAMLVGLGLFALLWQIVAQQGGRIPEPGVVWGAALRIFADPFYRDRKSVV